MLTEREKRILTLLARYGALAKKELAQKEGVSWATVVKLMTRLEKAGLVQAVGLSAQPEITGKNPILYDLAAQAPLAIGIDLTPQVSRLALVNLKNMVLKAETYSAAPHSNLTQLQNFIGVCGLDFIKSYLPHDAKLAGLGIGMPAAWLPVEPLQRTRLQSALAVKFQTPVRFETPARNYAIYQKWTGAAVAQDDFILVTIQEGLHTAIFYNGQLVRGAHGQAGDIQHVTIANQDVACSCGRHGCLGRLVNQETLARAYLEMVAQPHDPAVAEPLTEAAVRQSLTMLFTLARQGHSGATALIQSVANHLAGGLAALVNLFDLPHVLIVGEFGADGATLLPALQQELQAHLYPGQTCMLSYQPLVPDDFARGAAWLMLQDYLTKL